MLIKTTSYLVDEKVKKTVPFEFKRDCDIFTFFTLLFHVIKGGVYSNDHLNISHLMHGGGGLNFN